MGLKTPRCFHRLSLPLSLSLSLRLSVSFPISAKKRIKGFSLPPHQPPPRFLPIRCQFWSQATHTSETFPGGRSAGKGKKHRQPRPPPACLLLRCPPSTCFCNSALPIAGSLALPLFCQEQQQRRRTRPWALPGDFKMGQNEEEE